MRYFRMGRIVEKYSFSHILYYLFLNEYICEMAVSDKEIRQMIKEELSKQEVKNLIDSKLSEYVSNNEFKKKIRSMAVDVLDDFFREMWRKNGFWKNPLKNK